MATTAPVGQAAQVIQQWHQGTEEGIKVQRIVLAIFEVLFTLAAVGVLSLAARGKVSFLGGVTLSTVCAFLSSSANSDRLNLEQNLVNSAKRDHA